MQHYRLTVDKFLDHAAKWHGDREVVEARADGATRRTRYADLRARSNLMSGALLALGMEPGDRVGTIAWNTIHHLELYYAAMGAGLVCHTLNPRLSADHLSAIIDEAEDKVIAVAADLLPLVAPALARCRTVRQVIVLDDEGVPVDLPVPVAGYEDLLARDGAPAEWGAFDEESAAGLCYTSGTTGKPKGVTYTHRSNYLHTLRALQADAVALTARETLLLAVPMFHANGWGLPFAAPAVGAKLVLPGRTLDGARLARLMRDEGVTLAVGVQTVWLGVADHLERGGETLPDLARVVIGGSACPDALLERLGERFGAEIQTSWGMTELSPIGAIAPPGVPSTGAGRAPLGLDLKLVDGDGATLPEQRGVEGRLMVRGHSVVERYFGGEESVLDAEGYFDTGDLATIDADGDLTINGRAKDLIKSGGEWINPSEIEAIVGAHPSVRHVAVVAREDVKWGERPVLVVDVDAAEAGDARGLIDLLRGRVPDWWLPDQVAAVDAMPLAASGKIDKVRLRDDLANGRISAAAAR
ncbi:AMP-binding protein [Sphingomonas sp. Mn802worker]|uniref:AMP-binding protein n=1 Tax=Sphingomonas sp. Mn802worker TaxID=629773 RepID=UPI00037FF063|nr:AMP-binding protein [Sphingomonas sp. Mn802worker]